MEGNGRAIEDSRLLGQQTCLPVPICPGETWEQKIVLHVYFSCFGIFAFSDRTKSVQYPCVLVLNENGRFLCINALFCDLVCCKISDFDARGLKLDDLYDAKTLIHDP